MSTKIYNGYRLTEGTDPFDFIQSLRQTIAPVRQNLDAQLLASLTVARIDKAWINSESVPAVPALDAAHTWSRDQEALSSHTYGHDPYRFSLTVGKDAQTGRYHVLTFTEEPDLRDAFEAMAEVEEYGYWNNSDAPAYVTDEQWDERRSAWGRVLPGYSAPSEVMFIYNPFEGLVGHLLGAVQHLKEMMLPQMPSIENRAKRIAVDAYTNYLVRVHSIEPLEAVQSILLDASNIAAVTNVVAAMLPEITPDVVMNGTDIVAGPDYADAVETACRKVYESRTGTLKEI